MNPVCVHYQNQILAHVKKVQLSPRSKYVINKNFANNKISEIKHINVRIFVQKPSYFRIQYRLLIVFSLYIQSEKCVLYGFAQIITYCIFLKNMSSKYRLIENEVSLNAHKLYRSFNSLIVYSELQFEYLFEV